MDRRFAADEWAALTNAEKMKRCQRMAEEAMKLARDASPNLADGYLQLAEQWLKLATDLGEEARRTEASRN